MEQTYFLFDIFSETLYILLHEIWLAKFFLYVICKVGSEFDGTGGGGKLLRGVNCIPLPS